MGFKLLGIQKNPGLLYTVNGILIGLIIITPIAGFVSPASAVILGFLGGPIILAGEKFFEKHKMVLRPSGTCFQVIF